MTIAGLWRVPWRPLASEFVGTAVLLGIGLSGVVLIFGVGSPVAAIFPDEGLRRVICGFLFGSVGASIALSPVGSISGAHINPVVTLGFRLMRRLDPWTTVAYILAQSAGAVLGSLPLLAWGSMGRSVEFGATSPGKGYTVWSALLGEVATTFAMIALLIVFLAFHRLRPFTPAMFPFLYAIMVYLEAPISGTSTNPARSLGPALISGQWHGWWIYWIGPLAGMVLAAAACSYLARRVEVAKLYHFDSDRDGLFRRKPSPRQS